MWNRAKPDFTFWNKRAMDYGSSKLFQVGEFTSHAGKRLPFKIECDAFNEADWDSLAQMILHYEKEPFCRAEGIPRGGLPLAKALNKYATGNENDKILICDDVWTTGASFKEYINENYPDWLAGVGLRWVIFKRGNNAPLNHCKALFTLPGVDY
tara:strand:+ start:262 stop:723 length:462 start_codon:yes stop_codon:yes gene_type:complete